MNDESTIKDGRELKGAAMRARLRAATEKIIAEVGVEAASGKAVAEYCGVSRGAMLHHYPTRDDLIIDTARHFWARAKDVVIRQAEDVASGRADVRSYVMTLYNEVFPPNALVTMLDLVVLGRTETRIGSAVNEILTELFHAYEEFGIRALSGSNLPQEDLRVVVTFTVSTLRGLRLQNNIEPDKAKEAAVIDMLTDLIEQRIAAAPSGSGTAPKAAKEVT
ncbi:TetR/AcrR family transcriptional regulator [Falsirhodobacter algicola]|uniref:TetR family transcriptional regulator n=1 Tax=Falsirhodobacter algicola TaxID=2692330 RepID=A0A8J8MRP2_9RHOB|nr:TetR/AcrR family transcriptional regulator [Falsirhodobacter algicola]QUS35289.1 TetR family transcriptional regulator [Falsirhodobacter algicola]